MSSQIALESLVQRGRSPFYTSLVSVYQKAHDALYEAKNATNRDIVKILKSIGFSESLKKVIITYTGLPVAFAGVIEDPTPNILCSLRENKILSAKSKIAHEPLGLKLATLGQRYNDRTGRLVGGEQVKGSPFELHVFIASSVFKLREGSGLFVFSPDELGAMTLHEVGHADLWLRVGYRANKSLLDSSDIVTYMKGSPDFKVIQELINILQANKNIKREWGEVLNTIEQTIADQSKPLSERQIETLSALSLVVMTEAASDESTILLAPSAIDYQRRKSTLFSVDEERSADDYATRHGAAGPLISALAKSDKLETSDTKRYLNMVVGSDLPIITSILKQFKAKFSIAPEELGNGYDPLFRRLELIIETAKHAFHDDKLPPEIAKAMKADIAIAEQYLKEYQNADHRQTRVMIKQWKDNVIKFGRLVTLPFQDRLQSDYNKIQDANRSLTRHSLYYLANK